MMRQIEEGDTKGGIIIPKDKFKGLWSFKRNGCGKKLRIDKIIYDSGACPYLNV